MNTTIFLIGLQVEDFNRDKFTEFILSILQLARRRRQVATEFTVIFIEPTPRLVNGVLEVAFFVESSQGTVFDGDTVFKAVEENEEELVQAVSSCYPCGLQYLCINFILVLQIYKKLCF